MGQEQPENERVHGIRETLAMLGQCSWGRSNDVRLVREGEEPDQRGLAFSDK